MARTLRSLGSISYPQRTTSDAIEPSTRPERRCSILSGDLYDRPHKVVRAFDGDDEDESAGLVGWSPNQYRQPLDVDFECVPRNGFGDWDRLMRFERMYALWTSGYRKTRWRGKRKCRQALTWFKRKHFRVV